MKQSPKEQWEESAKQKAGCLNEKIKKIDKSLANLTKIMKEKTQIKKLKIKKWRPQPIPRISLGNTLKTYIQIN
jgi:hypothetical protein